jgi:hypothetical protein
MNQDLNQKILQRLQELPPDVRNAIQSADFDAKIQSITSAHKLHLDQAEIVGDETMLLMLGFTAPADFVGQIAAQAKISKEVADGVSRDIGEKLLMPIRESMKKFIESRSPSTSAPVTPPPAATAPAPIKPVLPPPTPVAPTAAPKPHPADELLTQKTVTTSAPATTAKPAQDPAKPQPYKADPYREPLE